jgi:hypothetical protein
VHCTVMHYSLRPVFPTLIPNPGLSSVPVKQLSNEFSLTGYLSKSLAL